MFTFIYITFRKAIKISPVRCKNLQKSLILRPDQIYYYLKSTQTSRHFIRKSSSDYRPLLILEEAQTCKPLVSESVSTLPEYQVILAICQHQAMKPRDYIWQISHDYHVAFLLCHSCYYSTRLDCQTDCAITLKNSSIWCQISHSFSDIQTCSIF